MSRLQDWPERLFATIDKHRLLSFEWGGSDCMQLVMDCAEAITGTHPYPNAKNYHTRAGALSCLKRHGFSDIVEALSAAYNVIPVPLAQRGDIGIIKLPDDLYASCVCDGMNFVGKAPGEDGITRVPRTIVLQAFRVE